MLILALLLLMSAAACSRADAVFPTPMDINVRATEIVLTENAPPAGFDTVSFETIDANLTRLPGWYYEASLSFNGVFARTPRATEARTELAVWYNQVANARRVVANVSGDLLGELDAEAQAPAINYEAVRLGPDVFLVRDGLCLTGPDSDIVAAADLSAGSLLGGVEQGRSMARRSTINGAQVWRYDFTLDDMRLPGISLGETGRILNMAGELWVSPQHEAVIRYYVNMEVDNAFVLGSDLPVTGTVALRYDLYEVGQVPNISVPFGC